MVQEKNNYCLCSILSDIFLDYNLKVSQDEIAKNLTPTKEGFRADDNKIKNFLKNNGFDYNFYWWNKTPFNEPDSLLVEISENDGFIAFGNHTVRVLEFEDPMITILDPANCNESPRDFDYSYLVNRLIKEDGGFGLIKHII